MSRIISVNLNKRLRNAKVPEKMGKWLQKNNVDLLLVQEPWNRGRKDIVHIPSYQYLGGNDAVGIWVYETCISPKIKQIKENWQELRLGALRLHNVYLSAYSSKERIKSLIVFKFNGQIFKASQKYFLPFCF